MSFVASFSCATTQHRTDWISRQRGQMGIIPNTSATLLMFCKFPWRWQFCTVSVDSRKKYVSSWRGYCFVTFSFDVQFESYKFVGVFYVTFRILVWQKYFQCALLPLRHFHSFICSRLLRPERARFCRRFNKEYKQNECLASGRFNVSCNYCI